MVVPFDSGPGDDDPDTSDAGPEPDPDDADAHSDGSGRPPTDRSRSPHGDRGNRGRSGGGGHTANTGAGIAASTHVLLRADGSAAADDGTHRNSRGVDCDTFALIHGMPGVKFPATGPESRGSTLSATGADFAYKEDCRGLLVRSVAGVPDGKVNADGTAADVLHQSGVHRGSQAWIRGLRGVEATAIDDVCRGTEVMASCATTPLVDVRRDPTAWHIGAHAGGGRAADTGARECDVRVGPDEGFWDTAKMCDGGRCLMTLACPTMGSSILMQCYT